MSAQVEKLASENRLWLCVECGKCTSVCPMAELFEDFSYQVSPRAIVEKVLLDFDVVNDPAIWYCLTCDECTDGCPSGVKFRDFIESLRLVAIEEGIREPGLFCKRCGKYFLPTHTLEHLKGKLGNQKVPLDFLNLCHRCRRYDFSEIVKENLRGSRRVDIPQRPQKSRKGARRPPKARKNAERL